MAAGGPDRAAGAEVEASDGPGRGAELDSSAREPCGGESGRGCLVLGALASMARQPGLKTALPVTRP